MRSVKISPSVASADHGKLRWAVQELERGGADLIHLDIEDGVFIPNMTFGSKTVKDLRPFTQLPFDVHLEVEKPEEYLKEIVEAGADIVTVQVEATLYPYRVLYLLKSLGVQAGLAFTAATPLDILKPVLDEIDVIHLMTAEPNGFADHFITGILDKIRLSKEMIGDRAIEIEVDGGINVSNAAKVVDAGASILVAGRAVWGEPEVKSAIESLRLAASAG